MQSSRGLSDGGVQTHISLLETWVMVILNEAINQQIKRVSKITSDCMCLEV